MFGYERLFSYADACHREGWEPIGGIVLKHNPISNRSTSVQPSTRAIAEVCQWVDIQCSNSARSTRPTRPAARNLGIARTKSGQEHQTRGHPQALGRHLFPIPDVYSFYYCLLLSSSRLGFFSKRHQISFRRPRGVAHPLRPLFRHRMTRLRLLYFATSLFLPFPKAPKSCLLYFYFLCLYFL